MAVLEHVTRCGDYSLPRKLLDHVPEPYLSRLPADLSSAFTRGGWGAGGIQDGGSLASGHRTGETGRLGLAPLRPPGWTPAGLSLQPPGKD